MESNDGEIDRLERGLLVEHEESEEEPVIYTASFEEREENFVKYQTVRWVTRPVPFPCFGDLKKEKYVLLPSVADIVVEQGYLQSLCGVYSIRIENVGVRRSPRDDLQIQGIADALDFRKAVLMQLSNLRSKAFSRQASVDDTSNLQISHSCTTSMSPSRSIKHDSLSHSGDAAVLQKLEEVGSSVKRVQNLIEEHHLQTSELAA
ncbi:uncharacterized protein [Solanum tuberosum]|uniref:DUF7642 domain-containing protein n=1 Tax=Solanum tuberosum TaxID=4113 RepID=M0ZQW4_SOLTU|nr:PREDICTED: uncharacterized protein LOC102592479 isoform X3 [Solanum tuberosum]